MLTSNENASASKDDELIEVLIAISVITRFLAKKLQNSKKTKGENNEQPEDSRRVN